jgi:hypothetical protein
MAKIEVSSGNAVVVRRAPGSTVTFINQSAVDVYFDADPNRLNKSVDGSIPDGSLLPANGGNIQFSNFPGAYWFRAAAATTIEAQP